MKNKTLLIIRGLPGAGKTTLADMLAPRANYAADDYFYNNGEYKWDKNKVHIAHNYCRTMIAWCMCNEEPIVAVHNTFAQRWMIKPYIKLAKEYGYTYHVIEVQGNHGNIHGCSQEVIDDMKNKWQEWYE